MLNLAILCPVKWIKNYGTQHVLKLLMADVALLESVSQCNDQYENCLLYIGHYFHKVFNFVSPNRSKIIFMNCLIQWFITVCFNSNCLQEHGVQLKIGPCVRSTEDTLSLVLADNLRSNGIGGLVESFSARRPYRFCMGILDEFQAKVILFKHYWCCFFNYFIIPLLQKVEVKEFLKFT